MRPIFDKSILIATFCNHRPSLGFHDSMVRLVGSLNSIFPESNINTLIVKDATLVWEARNRIAHAAISGKFDFLFFIDSDITFSVDDFNNLVLNCINITHPKPVLRSGVYLDRRIWAPVACVNKPNTFEDVNKIDDILTILEKIRTKRKMVPVSGLPMGFTLIETKILKDMSPPWFFEDYEHDSLNRIGEDYHFCFKAMDIGVVPILDCTVLVGHECSTVLNPMNLMGQYEHGGPDAIKGFFADKITEAGV